MRRVLAFIICILLLATPALAVSELSAFQSYSTVDANGSCQVSLNLTIHLESAVEELLFPIPENASSVSLNGQTVHPRSSGHIKNISLDSYTAGRTGDISLSIHYTLSDLISTDENDKLILTLPLLSGFSYPISNMEFTVTLPGEVTARPTFSSGYHQESIESDLVFATEGTVVSGIVKTQLKDHETLTMTLEVPEEQFPASRFRTSSVRLSDIFAIVFLALALLYWLLTLRCLPTWPIRYSTAPEGLSAGCLGSRLTAAPSDLTLMVFTWAQLGYILIQSDDNGRILLHKRMDMGNERSAFENRLFKNLFGRRRIIDGTGYHYAKLCQKTAKAPAQFRSLYRRNSGNPRIFRGLSAASAMMCGISIATAVSSSAVWGTVLTLLLGIFGAVSGWCIQTGCYHIHLRDRRSCRLGLILCTIWLLLGLICGMFPIALLTILGQILTGIAAAYGGRRNDLGRQTMQQILGLRRYLRKTSPEELRQILRTNPDYFYQMAPYALALGVDRTFARHCSGISLPECSYLVSSMRGQLTAMEWNSLLRDTAEALDERYHQLPYERIFGK